MADDDCNKGRVLAKDCPPEDTTPRVGTPFDLCVGNYTLHYDGHILWTTRRSYQIPDGTFTQITFSDGCITGVGQAPVAGYTPSDCCAPPGHDPTPGGSGGGTIDISPVACNWLSRSAQGLYVTPHVIGVGGVTVSGCGTTTDPLTISISGAPGSGGAFALQDLTVMSPTGTVQVGGAGTPVDPLTLDLKKVGSAGVYGGLDVDAYGRVVGYSAPTNDPVTTVQGGRGISVTSAAGTAIVELSSPALSAAGSFYTPPDPVLGGTGKRVYYNEDGIIINVVAV